MKRRCFFRVLLMMALMGVAVMGYTKVMARISLAEPPLQAADALLADHLIVSKADRRLYLMQDGRVLQSYDIAMGARWDGGPKQSEGDERTPEGEYRIDWRNPQSVAHLSLHISYPDAADQARAAQGGYDPGGNIMIHGLPNGWGAIGPLHLLMNWTDGCIAVTNSEMREIWARTPDGTPITIKPEWTPEA
ncbi:L,D-transpeptidase family protein [Pseudosulfitobacter pseudonitzschiae]|uniref:L,D-transpeptidase family protein n=1 Tax=Pseudosulfitobacter pseudonitzschiae TaxID=1402135 RepID=UPI001E57E4F0|nr:L,D-transpeptidase family protein [Pseudosulfitobacter pseudonitzschiae]MCD2309613.1 L,D-transpeptidase family protein [Pseudosulfitobacter pseudonitzschiae]